MSMDNNITLKKFSSDASIGWLSLELMFSSHYVLAKTNIISSGDELIENSKIIDQYVKSDGRVRKNIYFGLGVVPCVYVDIRQRNKRGQVKLDVKLEMKDSDGDIYHCFYPVICELGALEQFSKKMVSIARNDEIDMISLY